MVNCDDETREADKAVMVKYAKKNYGAALWLLLAATVCCCALHAMGIIGGAGSARVFEKEYTVGYSSYVYTGDVVGGKFSGEGEVVFPDGSSYAGGFSEGRFEGNGVFTSADGWQYVGNFSSGRITGDGVFYDSDEG